MKNKNNILLITNSEEISESFAAKLMLLRADDKISLANFEEACEVLEKDSFNLVILHEAPAKDLTLDLINNIRKLCPNTALILLLDNLEEDFVLTAYDAGVNDYFLTSANSAEILIKTVNSLRNSSRYVAQHLDSQVLKHFGLMSPITEFYKEKCVEEVFNYAIELEDFKGGVFLILTYDEADKAKFESKTLALAVKNSIRVNDVVVEMKKSKYYILLAGADSEGAEAVFAKIINNLDNEFRLKAGFCNVKKDKFACFEKKASHALSEAMLSDLEFVSTKTLGMADEFWVEGAKSDEKNYKLFKQTFCKKLEKVIDPVFYRLQKTYEDKIIATKIEQYTDEIKCIFRLKSKFQSSKLTIMYPGLAKVIVYITHDGLDSPENKEISIPLNKINQKYLTDILEDFIGEYKTVVEKRI